MLRILLLAGLAAAALLASCSDAPTTAPEAMPPRAWTDEPIDAFQRSMTVAGGEDEATMTIEVFEVGTGTEAANLDTVSVHYTGWVHGRTRHFDSSHDKGRAISFPLGTKSVINGWDLGIEGMRVGTRARLRIPAVLGYGSQGAGGGLIPPDADLVFDVELIAVR